eukprot:361009-Chlamydomonas_euryale.AAC.1
MQSFTHPFNTATYSRPADAYFKERLKILLNIFFHTMLPTVSRIHVHAHVPEPYVHTSMHPHLHTAHLIHSALDADLASAKAELKAVQLVESQLSAFKQEMARDAEVQRESLNKGCRGWGAEVGVQRLGCRGWDAEVGVQRLGCTPSERFACPSAAGICFFTAVDSWLERRQMGKIERRGGERSRGH